MLLSLPYLTEAYAEIGQFADARRCISEAMMAIETTKQRWWEAEVYRMAGEIPRMSPDRDDSSAEAHFKHSLSVARQQQAKSWELRAAMSLARLWREQGKVQQARELLAPVYGWFTEGFDTLDLKEAKALLGSWRHRGSKPNDDCDLLWRYSEEVGRLCKAERVGAQFTRAICYAAVYECEAFIGYGGRFGRAKAVGINAS